MPVRVHRLVLALPLCLSACGIVYDDTSGPTSDQPNTTEPNTTDATGTTAEVGSTGGATDETAGSSTATTDDATTAPTTGQPTGTDPTTGETSDGTTGGAVEQLPPIDSAEVLEAWLAGGSYKSWAGESKVHMSTGPHGGNVRTYVNEALFQSLSDMSPMHAQGAATVKELYGDSMDAIIGYAVMVKVAPDSQNGDGWYWYERLDQTVYADGTGVGLCTGCHVGGADYVLTPFPLQ